MLSFRAVFSNDNDKFNNEWNNMDLTWYDDPSDDPYDFEYVDEEDNTTYVAWTEHLIRFHDKVIKCYSEGYSLFYFVINIYRDHDQTQDDILFSMTHFPKDYNNCINLIKEALGNYTEACKEDLKFIQYIEQNLTLFNKIIILNKNISNFLYSNEIKQKDIPQIKDDVSSLFNLPYLFYQANMERKKEIVNNIIPLLKGYLDHFNIDNNNNANRAKDSMILLINGLKNIISKPDYLHF